MPVRGGTRFGRVVTGVELWVEEEHGTLGTLLEVVARLEGDGARQFIVTQVEGDGGSVYGFA
jgi:hypothetical protein